jgi:threonine synthase
MVRAFLDGAEEITDKYRISRPRGIAKAFLRGDPSSSYPTVRAWGVRSQGTFVRVSEVEIIRAMEALKATGIPACPEGAAALAAAMKMGREGRISREHAVLVNITGRDPLSQSSTGS